MMVTMKSWNMHSIAKIVARLRALWLAALLLLTLAACSLSQHQVDGIAPEKQPQPPVEQPVDYKIETRLVLLTGHSENTATVG